MLKFHLLNWASFPFSCLSSLVLNLKAVKSSSTQHVLALLQWTRVMLDVLNFQTTWRLCSGHLPWWCQTMVREVQLLGIVASIAWYLEEGGCFFLLMIAIKSSKFFAQKTELVTVHSLPLSLSPPPPSLFLSKSQMVFETKNKKYFQNDLKKKSVTFQSQMHQPLF